MNDIHYIGPRIVPDDVELSDFLHDLAQEHEKLLVSTQEQLSETVLETIRKRQPIGFAYGKLMNYLNAQRHDTLVYLCAAAIWKTHTTHIESIESE